MTIREMIGQGVHYARTSKSLWLFGFVVGAASGGSSGGGSGGDGGGGGAAAVGGLLAATEIVPIAIAILVAVAVAIIIRFISEGALIEGVARARQGAALTTREALRAGWAHWGVLTRISLLYFGAAAVSIALLVAPIVLAVRGLGALGGVLVGLPALFVAVPWLVTLYLVQAFAMRIAVLENRHARDAIAKARLFLHGRLIHGLKLIVATFLGTIGFALLAIVAIAPVVLLAVASIRALPVPAVIVVACLVLLPVLFVLTAMVGTLRSSIWTIGYVTEVES
jgi:hypothetical protein